MVLVEMEVFVWREIHITDSYEEIFYYTTYKIAYISVLVFRRLREFRLLIPINSKQNRRQRDLYLFGFVGLFKICFSFIL